MKWSDKMMNSIKKRENDDVLNTVEDEVSLDDQISNVVEEIRQEKFEEKEVEPSGFEYHEPVHYYEEESIIEKNTTVNGNIECEGSLVVRGEINGDITVSGKVSSYGEVHGNTKSKTLVLENAKHVGDVVCEQYLEIMDSDSSIEGNIEAHSCHIEGKIIGNLKVTSTCQIGRNAVVIGDIISGGIEIAAGAVVRGHLDVTSEGE